MRRVSRRALLGAVGAVGAVGAAGALAACAPSAQQPAPGPTSPGSTLTPGATVTPTPRIPAADDQPWRPQFHYSPASGNLADPNGLVHRDGVWHLFHQSDGRWAHATSPDLVRWTRLPIALEHDDLGQALTGSAVVDGDELAALYTNTTGGEAQSLATSRDGITWARHAGNPVLPNDGRRDFRDPQVRWHEGSGRWVMAVSLGSEIGFYGSSDLVTWDELSRFSGALRPAVWECPNLVELPRIGGGSAWVLVISVGDSDEYGGSFVQYVVGDFDGRTFSPSQEAREVDAGRDFYAPQVWTGTGDRVVWIGWMGNWRYPYQLPTAPWHGVMSVPRDLALAADGTLVQSPVPELDTLAGTPVSLAPGQSLEQRSFTFSWDVTAPASLRVLSGPGGWVEIGVDGDGLYVDRRHEAVRTITDRDGRPYAFGQRRSARLAGTGPVTLRGLVDRSTIEVFAGGRCVSMVALPGDQDVQVTGVTAPEGANPLVIAPMDSIWAR